MGRWIACFLSAFVLAACSGADGHEPDAPDVSRGGPALVTVFGDVGLANRGPLDPDTDTLFDRYGLGLVSAVAIGWDQLAALDQYSIDADFPAGGMVHEFSGPLLRDVLGLTGPGRGDLVFTAIDGYQLALPQMVFEVHDVLLAIRVDGEAMPLGGLGPAMLAWPRINDDALAGMPDDNWIWGVFAIEVLAGAPVE